MAAVRALLSRSIAGLPLGDVLLAVACGAESQVDAWTSHTAPTPHLAHALLALASTLPLALRRRVPLASGTVIFAAQTLQVALPGQPLGSPGTAVALYVALYS